MDIASQRRSIIDRLEKVEDESLLLTVENLLDFALGKNEDDELLRQSLDRGIKQSKGGLTRSNEVVMTEIKAKYG